MYTLVYCVAYISFYFSKLSSMRTVLCGIIILCLLTIIHVDNMKTEAAKLSSWNSVKKLMVARCCAKFCKKDDVCAPNPRNIRGCKCFTRDKRFKEGGTWEAYP